MFLFQIFAKQIKNIRWFKARPLIRSIYLYTNSEYFSNFIRQWFCCQSIMVKETMSDLQVEPPFSVNTDRRVLISKFHLAGKSFTN